MGVICWSNPNKTGVAGALLVSSEIVVVLSWSNIKKLWLFAGIIIQNRGYLLV